MGSPMLLEAPKHALISSSIRNDVVKIISLPLPRDISPEGSSVSTPTASINEKNTSDQLPVSEHEIETPPPLPWKRYERILRHARHTFFNVYRRLFSVVFVLNSIGVIVLFLRHRNSIDRPELRADLADITAANIMVALLVRQDYIINTMFK